MADYTATITALGDQIAGLKLNEAAALAAYLKEKYQIEARGPVVMEDRDRWKPDPILPPPPTERTVVLEGLADATKKVAVIKVVREITGCPLNAGKAFVESAPRAIKEAITPDEAEVIRKKLEEAGAKVSLK